MTRLAALLAVLPLLAASTVSAAGPQPHDPALSPRRHHARRFGLPPTEGKSKALVKRGFNGKATFYAVGLGACGGTNTDSDFVVALNQPQFEANKWCYKPITITYGGKSAQAQIVDECPGCPYGGLDMSPALFKHFADESAGVFYMQWSLGGGDGGGDDTPTTSSSWQPTTTWQAPTTSTSYWTPTSSSTPWTSSASSSPSSSPSSSSSWSSTSSAYSSANASSTWTSAFPSSSGNATSAGSNSNSTSGTYTGAVGAPEASDGTQSSQAYENGNLDAFSQIIIGMGALTAAGAKHAMAGASA